MNQEQFALLARQYGLPWRRSLIAQIETGRRHLALEEFLALPYMLESCQDAPWTELLPEGQEGQKVSLTPDLECDLNALRVLIMNAGKMKSDTAQFFRSPRTQREQEMLIAEATGRHLYGGVGPPMVIVQSAFNSSNGEAEQKGAASLGVSAFDLSLAAFKLWDCSLTSKRESELTKQINIADLNQRAVQAKRGHITRGLLDAIAVQLGRKAIQKRSNKKGGRSKRKKQ